MEIFAQIHSVGGGAKLQCWGCQKFGEGFQNEFFWPPARSLSLPPGLTGRPGDVSLVVTFSIASLCYNNAPYF
jgi:hypothetical protein